MSAIVKLEVMAGPWSGREFRFDQHDTFVLGRALDLQIQMPADDKTVSRHHILIEANPPDPAALLERMLRDSKPAAEETPDIRGYELGNKLSEGDFGAVYHARCKRDGESVAVKIMLARVAFSAGAREKFLREVEVTKDLLHRNIVALLAHAHAKGFEQSGLSGMTVTGNVGGRIVPIRERDARVPKKLAEGIDRSLAADPRERYQDAAQMHDALVKVL